MATRVAIDWQRIKSKLIEGGHVPDELLLFPLPDAGRHLLMAVFDRLRWQSTYQSPIDDELQTIIDTTYRGLMGGDVAGDDVDLSDIYNRLEELEEMNIINNVGCGCGCGGSGSGGGALPGIEEPLGPGQDFDEPVPSGDLPDEPVSSQYTCDVATWWANALVSTAAAMENYTSWASLGISGLWTLITAPEAVGAAGAGLGALGFFSALTVSAILGIMLGAGAPLAAKQFKDTAGSARDDIICAITSSQNGVVAKAAVKSVVAKHSIYGRLGGALMSLFTKLVSYDAFYNGELAEQIPPEYSGSICPCGETSPIADDVANNLYWVPQIYNHEHAQNAGMTYTVSGNLLTVDYNSDLGGSTGTSQVVDADPDAAMIAAGFDPAQGAMVVGVLSKVISAYHKTTPGPNTWFYRDFAGPNTSDPGNVPARSQWYYFNHHSAYTPSVIGPIDAQVEALGGDVYTQSAHPSGASSEPVTNGGTGTGQFKARTWLLVEVPD